jgi:hypothetical protein
LVRLYRCLPHDSRAAPETAGGALFVAREFQGQGRHDNPELYGALYLSEQPVSAVAEQLARFRGIDRLEERHLRRRALPLALATLELDESAVIVDLDNPRELDTHELRPSIVATRNRVRTQPQAATLYGHPSAPVGIRWWSTLEAGWLNVTLFAERVQRSLRFVQVEPLTLELGATREAAEFIGLR